MAYAQHVMRTTPLARALLPALPVLIGLSGRLPAAAVPAGLAVATPTEVRQLGFDPATLARIDASVARGIEQRQMAGAVTLIARQGRIVHFSAAGLADLESGRPMTRDSIFRLASMTKPIASLALLLLMEDGKCRPDDRLDTFLPEFARPDVLVSQDDFEGLRILKTRPAAQPILLRHLLTHTAGLASQYGGTLGAAYEAAAKDQFKSTLEAFCKRLARLPLDHEPGEGWIYGPGINVLSRVVEVISGQPLPEFLERRIFGPLGMKDTKFFLEPADAPRLTTYYERDAAGALKVLDPGTTASQRIAGPRTFFSGSGGLNSTAADYFTFCQMVLQDGEYNGVRIARPATIALMKADQIPADLDGALPPTDGAKRNGFTFGYQIKRRDGGPDPLPAGTLRWGGATGPRFCIDPADGLVAIFLTQLPSGTPLEARNAFYPLVMESRGRRPGG
jgi:CubicO group peptidase (beta-lactamase class C family)